MQSGFSVMLWKSAFWTVAGLVVLSPLWLWMTFNRLVRSRNRLKEAWSGIEVQLKRRHDLVPVLVSCVKGYQAHERGTLENLTLARSQAMAAQGVEQLGAAENDLSRCLRSVIAVAEAYPELKANQTYQQLSINLVEIEDQLQYARRYYNGSVRDYNILVESFPSLLAARWFGFAGTGYFEIESAVERLAPEVKL